MAGKLRFSYSKMAMYRECPLKYKFRYIQKLPEKPKYYFAFGTALHSVMEFLYSAPPPFPPLERTIGFFKQNWDSTSFEAKGYPSKEKEQEGFLEGVRIIQAYYEKHLNDTLVPLATELSTTVDIDGLSVIGIVDRIDYLGEGKVSILDYKTGKTLKREPDQLMMYQKVLQNSPAILPLVQARDAKAKKVEVERMAFYHLPTLKEDVCKPVSDTELATFWQGVLKTAQDILSTDFKPTPSENACRWCDYRNLCPVWSLDTAPKTEPVEIEEEETLPEKIDRYGVLIEQGKKIKAEIIKLMQNENLTVCFGKHYKTELKENQIINFPDEKKTLQTLENLGLLQKTLKPTLKSIAALLEDKTVPEEKKDKLHALSSTLKQVQLSCVKTEE